MERGTEAAGKAGTGRSPQGPAGVRGGWCPDVLEGARAGGVRGAGRRGSGTRHRDRVRERTGMEEGDGGG